jgi:hypothetical protein
MSRLILAVDGNGNDVENGNENRDGDECREELLAYA